VIFICVKIISTFASDFKGFIQGIIKGWYISSRPEKRMPMWSLPETYRYRQYQSDACHSLSIEGYRVNNELIERVKAGGWELQTDFFGAPNRLFWSSKQTFWSFPKTVQSL
jgi:hypothetical protein